MAIDRKKSNRLLGNRRFTSDLTTAQEAFDQAFDINSNEIYTQTNAPTLSSYLVAVVKMVTYINQAQLIF